MSTRIQDRWLRQDGSPTARYGTGARYRVHWLDLDGEERSWSWKTIEAARAFERRAQAALARGISPRLAHLTTVGGYAAHWLGCRPVDPSTIEADRQRLAAYILPQLGKTRLTALDRRPSLVAAWLARLGERLAPASVHAVASVLRQLLAAAADDHLLNRNPFDTASVTLPRLTRRQVTVWRPEQVTAVRDCLPPRWQLLADLGNWLGLRQGEALAVAADVLDPAALTVNVCRQLKRAGGRLVLALPKGGKTRTLPIAPELAERIAAHIEQHPPVTITMPWHEPGTVRHGQPVTVQLLITTTRQRPADAHTFNRRVWKPALLAAGIAPSRESGSHMLRHCFASRVIADGADLETLRGLLGHASAQTTSAYIHTLAGPDDRARQAVASTVPCQTVLFPAAEPPAPGQRRPCAAAPTPDPLLSADLLALDAHLDALYTWEGPR